MAFFFFLVFVFLEMGEWLQMAVARRRFFSSSLNQVLILFESTPINKARSPRSQLQTRSETLHRLVLFNVAEESRDVDQHKFVWSPLQPCRTMMAKRQRWVDL